MQRAPLSNSEYFAFVPAGDSWTADAPLDVAMSYGSWVDKGRRGRVPAKVEHYLEKLAFEKRIAADVDFMLATYGNAANGEGVNYVRAELEESLEDTLADRAKRRQMEQELSDYVFGISQDFSRHDLFKVSCKLNQCRLSGTAGQSAGGKWQIVWDQKCGLARLCPDESREETQRLTERYAEPLREWVQSAPAGVRRRLIYAVMTDHNYRPGQLKAGKKILFEKFNAWRKDGQLFSPVIANKKRTHPAPWYHTDSTCIGDAVKGAFVCQEDPLSADGDWNIHLNVILMVEGNFDYGQARQQWGTNVHFQAIDPDGIAHSIRELVKYSAMIVPAKSADKAEDGMTAAPAMTAWNPERWIEWFDAGQGFRRTRCYGELYALERKRWQAADDNQQYTWAMMARSWGADLGAASVGLPWAALTPSEKVAVRRAMSRGVRVEDSVTWLGSVSFSRGFFGEAGCYLVDLIPGDNFFRDSGFSADKWGKPPPNGPPPDQSTRYGRYYQ